jgi:hypothetical protein
MATWADATSLWTDTSATWGGYVFSKPVAFFTGPIITDYRFDLLDPDEKLIGTLDGVRHGGSITWDAYASVKGGGSITVRDLSQGVDWLNVRIRIVVERRLGGTSVEVVEHPIGVFLPSAPVEQWDSFGREWTVELADKLAILDQDVVVADGKPVSYSVPAGANIVDTIKDLITDAGESVAAIEPDATALNKGLIWEAGTTRLRIINDLLNAGNFFSLWCDGAGQYRVVPYVPPRQRAPVFNNPTPFSYGNDSFMSPKWSRDRDIYKVPNRYVVVGQGDGEAEALTAVATNTNPDSPFSYANRGNRWITASETGVEAVDQAALDAYARRQLSAATSVTASVEVEHLFFPQMLVNSLVRFVNPDAGLDIWCAVIKTSIELDPIKLCKSTLRDMTWDEGI